MFIEIWDYFEGKKGMSTVAKILLVEPAFQIDSLKYILGESESTDEKQEPFSLANCKYLLVQTNVLH